MSVAEICFPTGPVLELDEYVNNYSYYVYPFKSTLFAIKNKKLL